MARLGEGRVSAPLPPRGRALYVHYGLDPDEFESNILLSEGIAWFKSEGSIRMAEGLGPPWSLARLLRVLPPRWRDALYMTMARNRLRWFGRRAVCYRAELGHEHPFTA
jgi:predicted DCC family thiol-disulfide oxidoreductase YuxK